MSKDAQLLLFKEIRILIMPYIYHRHYKVKKKICLAVKIPIIMKIGKCSGGENQSVKYL